jgi:hypothetical protein
MQETDRDLTSQGKYTIILCQRRVVAQANCNERSGRRTLRRPCNRSFEGVTEWLIRAWEIETPKLNMNRPPCVMHPAPAEP